jgi:hypothetical protein
MAECGPLSAFLLSHVQTSPLFPAAITFNNSNEYFAMLLLSSLWSGEKE